MVHYCFTLNIKTMVHSMQIMTQQSGSFVYHLGGETAKLQAPWDVCFWISHFSSS